MIDNPQLSIDMRTVVLEDTDELPMPHINAFLAQSGIADDFFITVGVVLPPDVTSMEELDKYESIPAKTLFRFAVSRLSMAQFINALRFQYYVQLSAERAEEEAERRAAAEAKEE